MTRPTGSLPLCLPHSIESRHRSGRKWLIEVKINYVRTWGVKKGTGHWMKGILSGACRNLHDIFLILVDCGSLTDPANGLVNHTAGTKVRNTATYSHLQVCYQKAISFLSYSSYTHDYMYLVLVYCRDAQYFDIVLLSQH